MVAGVLAICFALLASLRIISSTVNPHGMSGAGGGKGGGLEAGPDAGGGGNGIHYDTPAAAAVTAAEASTKSPPEVELVGAEVLPPASTQAGPA